MADDREAGPTGRQHVPGAALDRRAGRVIVVLDPEYAEVVADLARMGLVGLQRPAPPELLDALEVMSGAAIADDMSDPGLTECTPGVQGELIGVSAAAARLGISERHVRRLLTAGDLRGIRASVRGAWLASVESIEQYEVNR